MSTEDRINRLRELRQEAMESGNQRAVDRQHDLGKLTARERIELLLDKGSFQELDMFVRHQATGFGIEENRPPGDAVITGWGTIDGRTAFVFAEDFTAFGGSLGEIKNLHDIFAPKFLTAVGLMVFIIAVPFVYQAAKRRISKKV